MQQAHSAVKKVTQTFVNETEELVHIHVNGETISATPSHPFYVNKFGWTLAGSLRAGDVLVLSNGEYVTVEWVQHEILESPVKVYNFEVEDFHTYFVGENSVLAHNMCETWNEFQHENAGKGYTKEEMSAEWEKQKKANGINSSNSKNREKYMGSTPGKDSSVGRAVIDRMDSEGKIRRDLNGNAIEFLDGKGVWRPLKDADMAHKTAAVTWWNETGRYTGARSPEVRTFMTNPDNYYLEYFRINRAEGATLPNYKPPAV